MNENNILGVVLAGGKSSRFGENKSNVFLGDKTLLKHTVEKIETKFDEILIISKDKKDYNFKNKKIYVVEDCIEGRLGPLIGILTAMKWVKSQKREYKWIASFPCDTPFFDRNLIDKLKLRSKKTIKKLIFVNNDDKRHNIFGLWSMKLIEMLEQDIKNNFRKVEIWANKVGFETVNLKTIKFDRFLNINTKEDLKRAKEFISKNDTI